MLTREDFEAREKQFLSPYASFSVFSRGRAVMEEPCPMRTAFQRDRDRIIHSKAFRRLKHKTQVFISPEGDHFRTRLTHALEVAGIARSIARGLALNEDLTEAIALGHDLGHTPFGHAGEDALNQLYAKGFHHNEQSLRVVDVLEQRTSKVIPGLNLTCEVRDGILNHTSSGQPFTLEGRVVQLADKIAYLNHDIDDAIRAGVLKLNDLPQDALKVLGYTHSGRIDLMVRDMIENSWACPEIRQSAKVKEAMNHLRDWMFANVYHAASLAKQEEQKAKEMLKHIYVYYLEHPEQLHAEYQDVDEAADLERTVVDYLAGMSDSYAISKAKDILIPRPWPGNVGKFS